MTHSPVLTLVISNPLDRVRCLERMIFLSIMPVRSIDHPPQVRRVKFCIRSDPVSNLTQYHEAPSSRGRRVGRNDVLFTHRSRPSNLAFSDPND